MAANSFISMPDDEEGSPLSPTDFVIDQETGQIIVCQKTGMRIDFLDETTGQLISSLPTVLPPTGICLSAEGRAYVTCSYSEGEVLQVNVKDRKMEARFPAGHGAICPVLSPGGDTLYVANQFNDDISVFELRNKREIARIDVLRQPMTMDITPEGRWLCVANLLPATRADLDTVAADVTLIDLHEMRAVRHLKLANGSNALRGIRIDPAGTHAFVSHNLGRFQVPTSQLEQGWMNTSALSVIDIPGQTVLATVLLDEPENGAAGSWGVDVTENVIAVAHSGTHDYSIIAYQSLLDKLGEHPKPAVLAYDLTFLTGIRKRVPVQGEGPRAIRLFGNQVFTALYFSDAIQVNDLASGEQVSIHLMNPGIVIDSIRLGEMVFNDARYCFQHWQSCNGCHPNEARVDGLNWDLLNDGIGNPKNCKSMLLAHATPPAMITGVRADAETAVRAGFRHIQFTSIEEGKALAVDRYLQSLEPVSSPWLEDGKLSEKAQNGKDIFSRESCDRCHPGPLYTDGQMHTIGTPGPADRTTTWDTPTLVEVWRTAPYLHDGRCATMQDVFDRELHGLEHPLPEDELEALVEFVMSL
jgi:YVTN family beta-propeller protein